MSWTTSVDRDVAWLRFEGAGLPTAGHADIEDLERALDEVEPHAPVIVLAGGSHGFIRHASLTDLRALHRGAPTSGDGAAWTRVLRRLDKGPALTIAIATGDVWGGGTELVLTCNLRWMADDATLGFPEARLGILPGVGGHRAARLLPEHLALEVLSGIAPIGAAAAERCLLVNGVFPAAEVEAHVAGKAAILAALPRASMRAVRDIVQRSRDMDTRSQQRQQHADFVRLLAEPASGALLDDALGRYDAGAGSREALGFGDT